LDCVGDEGGTFGFGIELLSEATRAVFAGLSFASGGADSQRFFSRFLLVFFVEQVVGIYHFIVIVHV
jgi:hypothetical protein